MIEFTNRDALIKAIKDREVNTDEPAGDAADSLVAALGLEKWAAKAYRPRRKKVEAEAPAATPIASAGRR